MSSSDVSRFSKKTYLWSGIFFLIIAFPYISFVKTPFDIQPYVFVAVALYMLFQVTMKTRTTVPRMIWFLLLPAVYSLFVYFFYSVPFPALRSIVGYFTLLVTAFLGYNTFPTLRSSFLILTVLIYSTFGLVQTFFLKTFGASILPSLRTSIGRGVTSLTVEPAQYAMTCMFLLLLLDFYYDTAKISRMFCIFLKILIFSQIILTFSGMGILLLVSYVFCRCLLRMSFIKMLLSFSLAFLGFFFLMRTPFAGTRGGVLISQFMTHGIAIVNIDSSMNDRFAHMSIPFYSLFDGLGIGFGLGTWSIHAKHLADSFTMTFPAFNLFHFSTASRIMSGWGTAVYELGMIGLLLVGGYVVLILKSFASPRHLRVSNATAAIMLLFLPIMSLSLAFPFLGFLTGVLLRTTSHPDHIIQ